ncbi:MAG: cation-transporting P-type ATPase [Alphaproteobacteria bacterium]|nr:cation-transporting P-type ATPase [Alphaproteobacteria bacterium]
MQAFARPVGEVAGQANVAIEHGLTEREVRDRQRRVGKNLLRRHQSRNAFGILTGQLKSLVIWLLAAAAALSFYVGDRPEGFAIIAVIAINTAIGFFTELRALRSMEALRRIARVQTRVCRDGQVRHVDALDLVPGDIVILEAGDIVTADLRLMEAANLECDESVLTGESVPVAKDIAVLAATTDVAERRNMAFKGTAITQGSGRGIVVGTGMTTELGRISLLVEEAEPETSPLEKRLDQLGHRLIWLTLLLAALTAGAGILRGREIVVMVETSIALAVAAVPEGLPVVATLGLARGMWRMARRHALMVRLSAVETLGATTVVLTDKTGTLTENRMTVAGYLFDDADTTIRTSVGDPGQSFEVDGRPISSSQDERLAWALRIGVLCTNATLPDDAAPADAQATGDPMEQALLQAGREAGMERPSLLDAYSEIEEHAFDPDLKMMATVHDGPDGHFVAVKGAPESVIERCNSVLSRAEHSHLDDAARRTWLERSDQAAKRGFRLLALAMRRTNNRVEDVYADLTLIGVACIADPIRADVPRAIAACRAAGVRVIMLTGDHPETAAEIARQAGLGNGDIKVIEGRELGDFDPATLDEQTMRRILSADVFARVAPEMKLKLATLFQRSGEIVAMTGDGVNDAPALKKADIGIAMGQRGTEVAREAAHMVLRDDAFPTIIAAMREGRIIFDNIRRFVVYLMSCNVSEVLVVGIAVGVGLPAPLLPLQILFLNLVTDIFPAFALGLGEGSDAVMSRPPRPPREPVLDRKRWILITVFGGLITLATLAAFLGALYGLGLDADRAVSVAFTTLALAQLWNVFNARDVDSAMLANDVTRNAFVWGAIILCLGLIAAALWLPGLSGLLRLPSPGADGLVLAALFSFTPLLLGQIALLSLRRGGRMAGLQRR